MRIGDWSSDVCSSNLVVAITESDVTLAAASNAPLIGFNVRPNAKARVLAERDKVRLKYFDVIYDLIEDIKGEMAGELGPERIETVVGRAEVKDVFSAGKHGKAAGLLVTDGFIRKALTARKIGRESRRERESKYMSKSVGAGS